jgi:hypothetical protein
MSNNYKSLVPLAGYLRFLLKALLVVQVLSLANEIWSHYSLKSTLAGLKSVSNIHGEFEAAAAPPSREDDGLQAPELVPDTETPASTDSLLEPTNDDVKQIEEDVDRRRRELDVLMAESKKAIEEADRVLQEANRSESWLWIEIYWSFALSVALFILYLLTGIFFLTWVYRGYRNLRAFSGVKMKRTPAWAVWSRFVPIANLFVPAASIEEMWEVSHKSSSGGLAAIWWLLAIISNLVNRAWLTSFTRTIKADNPIEALASDQLFLQSLGGSVLELAVTALTLVLVTRITAAYKQNIVENLTDVSSEVATGS